MNSQPSQNTFVYTPKKGPSGVARVERGEATPIIFLPPEALKLKGTFFSRELVLSGPSKVSKSSLSIPAELLTFSAAVERYFDAGEARLDEEKMIEKGAFFWRFRAFEGRAMFAGGSGDRCPCGRAELAPPELAIHSCGQIFHRKCLGKEGPDCPRCRETVTLRKRDVRDGFDLSGMEEELAESQTLNVKDTHPSSKTKEKSTTPSKEKETRKGEASKSAETSEPRKEKTNDVSLKKRVKGPDSLHKEPAKIIEASSNRKTTPADTSSTKKGIAEAPISINDTPQPKTLKEKVEGFLAKARADKGSYGATEGYRKGTRDAFFNLFLDIFKELTSVEESTPSKGSDSQPQPTLMTPELEKLVRLKIDPLFSHLLDSASRLEKEIFLKNPIRQKRNTDYTTHAKTLLLNLRKPKFRPHAVGYLLGDKSFLNLAQIQLSFFEDAELKGKLEKCKEQVLAGYESKFDNVLIKTTKGETIIDPNEAIKGAEVPLDSVVSVKPTSTANRAKPGEKINGADAEKFAENETGRSDPFEGLAFRSKLLTKIGDMLEPETAKMLVEYIGWFE